MNTLILGPENKGINTRSDVSAYTTALNATVEASEQNRPSIPPADYERAVYEEEPIVAKRVIGVDRYGELYSEDNPMPTYNAASKLISKEDYGNAQQLIYIAEALTGTEDDDNGHFIENFIYDNKFNVTRTLIASNKTTVGSTNIDLTSISPGIARISILDSGDYSDVIIENGSLDLLTLTTELGQVIVDAPITSKISDTEVEITYDIEYATASIQGLNYTAVTPGTVGNSITIEYLAGGTAGSEGVGVVGSAITVTLEDGVSTASQVKAAIDGNGPASALVTSVVANDIAQTTQAPTNLTGGVGVLLVTELNQTISESDFTIYLNNYISGDCRKRRWTNRTRYIYE
jgi:hypothetical protein